MDKERTDNVLKDRPLEDVISIFYALNWQASTWREWI